MIRADRPDISISLDGRVADIMELALYNAVLTAMSHEGTKFTYVNQLASSDEDPSKREAWLLGPAVHRM